MRLLAALFVLLVYVHCVLAQEAGPATSTSDRISSRIENNKQRISEEVAAVKSGIQQLKSSLAPSSQRTKEDALWLKSLERRVAYINDDVAGRMKTLFPASQQNRAEAAGMLTNSRVTSMRGGTGMEARLARYGNPGYVSKEVVSTASQQLPRDIIVAQLMRKFSNLEKGEVNDIIVSAFVHTGKAIPQLNEMGQQEALNEARSFKKIKADNDRAPPEWFKAKK